MSGMALGVGAIALIGAIVVAILLVLGKKVPPVVGALPAALPLFAVWFVYRAEQVLVGVKVDDYMPDTWAVATVASVADALGSMGSTQLAVGLPALILILGGAVAAARKGPRKMWLATLGVVVTIALVVVPPLAVSQATGGALGDVFSELIIGPRLGFLVLGCLASIALLAGNKEKSGPEGAATAVLAAALGVAAIEVSQVGIEAERITAALAAPEVSDWMWASGAWRTAGFASMGVAAVLGLLGLLAMGTNGKAGRWISGLVGLVLLALGPMVLGSLDPAGFIASTHVDVRDALFPVDDAALDIPTSDATLAIPWTHTAVITEGGVYFDGGTETGEALISSFGTRHIGYLNLDRPALVETDLEGYSVPKLREHYAAVALATLERTQEGAPLPLLHQISKSVPFGIAGPVLASAEESGWADHWVLVDRDVGGRWAGIPVDILTKAPVYDEASPRLQLQVHITFEGYDVYGNSWLLDREGSECLEELFPTWERYHTGWPWLEGFEWDWCEEHDNGDENSLVYKDPDPVIAWSQTRPVPEDYNWDRLTNLLSEVKDSHPNETEVLIVPEEEVPWDVVVAAMDASREDPTLQYADGPRPLFPDVKLLTTRPWNRDILAWEPPLRDPPYWVPRRRGPRVRQIVLGGLPRELIDKVVRNHMNQIRYCYQKELVKNHRLRGAMSVRFIIKKDGTVSTSELKSSELGNATVEKCVVDRFYHMVFPQPRGGGQVIVSYPFKFAPGE